MATAIKKRKTDSDGTASDQTDSAPPFNPRPQRQTIYFPITDDNPSPTTPSANGAAAAAAAAAVATGGVPPGARRSPSPESEPESETDAEEPISSLLEGLSREQLINLLRHAATVDPNTLVEIRRVVDLDPAARKLFVHGLGWDANSDALRAAFLKYGEIDDCRVITDKGTGRSKGYGFVLFRHRSSAKRALRRPNKKVGSRMAICQLASSGGSGNPNPNSNPSSASGAASSQHSDNSERKIYVANVHANFNVDRLYNFFAQYGEIEEGPLGFDRQTGKPKGFALFVYKTAEAARKALEEPVKNFEGNILNCQKASDGGRNKSNPNSNQNPNSNPSMNPNAPNSNLVMSGGMAQPVTGAAASGYDMSGYNSVAGMAGQVQPDMSQAQNAMFGLGMGQPNAAFLAMIAAAMQNPAGFGMNPAMMAAMNPAFAAAAALGGSQPAVPGSVGQVGSVGLTYPTAGFQMPPGFQGPPGFPSGAQQGSGSTGVYQGSSVQGQLPGASTTMGGY